jgi:mRNA-degrading endonuclease RelE of RelBE toxin-antitoxin system
MTNNPPVQVEATPRFTKVLRKLRKKYPNIVADLTPLLDVLAQGETPGDQVTSVGYTAYKARIPNRDAQRGKSGGYRVIYYIRTAQRVILIDIYSKSEQVDISPEEIRRLIEELMKND